MRLIDSHCHIQADAFASDAEAVLSAARDGGVARLLAPGWDLPSSRASVDLSGVSAGIDASVGIHPHVARDADGDAWREVGALAADVRVVAVGETGLDYDRGFSSQAAQVANLRAHLAVAFEVAKPVVLHCRSARGSREAQDDLLRELRDAGLGTDGWRRRFSGRSPAVLHSFSGPLDYGLRAVELGLAVSFSGLAFRAGEERTADVAREVPEDRLLVETDSPYLSPPGAPRRRNEPRWVEVTARWLAEQRGTDPETLGQVLVANYDRMFGRGDHARVSV